MSGTNLLIDTNIVLYLLAGDETLAEMLNEKNIYVSFITEMELLGYKGLSAAEGKSIQVFLADVQVIEMTSAIKQRAIAIRKSMWHKIARQYYSCFSGSVKTHTTNSRYRLWQNKIAGLSALSKVTSGFFKKNCTLIDQYLLLVGGNNFVCGYVFHLLLLADG